MIENILLCEAISITKVFGTLIDRFEDPICVALLMIVGAQLLAIRQLFKMLAKRDERDREFGEALGSVVKGLTKLTILVEVLVHGRRPE